MIRTRVRVGRCRCLGYDAPAVGFLLDSQRSVHASKRPSSRPWIVSAPEVRVAVRVGVRVGVQGQGWGSGSARTVPCGSLRLCEAGVQTRVLMQHVGHGWRVEHDGARACELHAHRVEGSVPEGMRAISSEGWSG